MASTDKEYVKFEQFAGEWWNPKGKFAVLHGITPLRFDYFCSKIGKPEGKRILDVGCGGGILAEEFAKRGALVTGIDLSSLSIDAARAHADESGLKIDYRVYSPGRLKEEDLQAYNAVICAEVLEHVDDLAAFVRDSSALLKEGGFFFFDTINRTLRGWLFAIVIAEKILGMIPSGTHDYKRLIRPSTLVSILRDNDVKVEEIRGITYDLGRFDFRISDDTSINYIGYGIKQS